MGTCDKQKPLMHYPVSEADLQTVELQFASKWKGLISFWCNRKHVLPYLSICKKCIHLAPIFSHTWWKENPQEIIFREFLCSIFTVMSGKGPEWLLRFWPFKQVDGCCTAPQSQRENSSNLEVAIRGAMSQAHLTWQFFLAVPSILLQPKRKNCPYIIGNCIFLKNSIFSCIFFANETSKTQWQRKAGKYNYQAFWNSTV